MLGRYRKQLSDIIDTLPFNPAVTATMLQQAAAYRTIPSG
jgi:hypothetical protein